jgi:hypothetical protein
VVLGLKPPLHRHNRFSFAKFQDTECILIPCPCHVLSCLPPVVKSWRLLPKQTWRGSLAIDMLLSAVSVLAVELPSSEISEGLINYPVYE